ncbi:Big_5 domain-containing protein [Rhodovastum atsumiense]|uniref:SbsA Ig-like domain-containing protein n=1 Tax=Rhodovastum atsumiense TaxID=504468 RepID=A0A5M6J0E3_9PROT|nr:Ig-like domain-containing protein [Rhodovastum atsumiense]KAA5613078.1 hypothetical protein F1189_06890 [Rhodovastum atsumiense]CAH2600056.1 Big_5 domain-containing protein [Rhodovastum atsumiense]
MTGIFLDDISTPDAFAHQFVSLEAGPNFIDAFGTPQAGGAFPPLSPGRHGTPRSGPSSDWPGNHPPQSRAKDTSRPVLVASSPANGAHTVAPGANIVLTFSEAVQAGRGNIIIRGAKGTPLRTIPVTDATQVTISGNKVTINPATDLPAGTGYRVSMAGGVISDLSGNPFAGLPQDRLCFRTAPRPAADHGFSITLVYSGNPIYRPAFEAAAARWSQVITRDLPDVAQSRWGCIDDLRIDARVMTMDGDGGLIGKATPDAFRNGRHGLPYHGTMEFDAADVANFYATGQLPKVILHEMGHVLGLGTLWSDFGMVSGNAYTGAHALAQYRLLAHDPALASVPLETNGGIGTAGGHWAETTFGSELLTGWATGGLELSRITVGSLADLGYGVNYAGADPYVLPVAPDGIT